MWAECCVPQNFYAETLTPQLGGGALGGRSGPEGGVTVMGSVPSANQGRASPEPRCASTLVSEINVVVQAPGPWDVSQQPKLTKSSLSRFQLR